jgi:SAM-dependent methyltransferase
MSKYDMKLMWNQRAEKDAFYYVESAFWNGDVDAFFALGEERSGLLIDPYLSELSVSPENAIALEIGCGLGRFSRALAKRFKHVIGLDVSDEMVRQATELNTSMFQNLEFQSTDGMDYLSVDSGSIDFIFSYEVFQHMPSPEVILKNLREVRRVMKPEGIALIHFMNNYGSFSKKIKKILKEFIPETVWKKLGIAPLKFDSTWTGTSLSNNQLKKFCTEAGLNIRKTIEDPTHGSGDRIFILLEPLKIQESIEKIG